MPNSLLSMRVQPAEMVGGPYGRNPSPLIPKRESTSDMPGGHNLLYCSGRLADSRRRPGFCSGQSRPGSCCLPCRHNSNRLSRSDLDIHSLRKTQSSVVVLAQLLPVGSVPGRGVMGVILSIEDCPYLIDEREFKPALRKYFSHLVRI